MKNKVLCISFRNKKGERRDWFLNPRPFVSKELLKKGKKKKFFQD